MGRKRRLRPGARSGVGGWRQSEPGEPAWRGPQLGQRGGEGHPAGKREWSVKRGVGRATPGSGREGEQRHEKWAEDEVGEKGGRKAGERGGMVRNGAGGKD